MKEDTQGGKRVKMKTIWAILVGVVLLVLVSSGVLALGITPGRTTANFEPGLEREVAFSVLNDEHKGMEVVLFAQGELNESIALFDSGAKFLPDEESKSFRYKFKLSNSLEPGLHTAEIVALEIPSASSGGTFVGATVAVVSQLYVYVPFPGKYVDFDLNVLNSEENTTATLVVPVVSRGDLGIGDLRAVIDIKGPLNEPVATLETNSVSLEAGKRTELFVEWPVNVSIGNYIARVTVFYDGESKSMEKEFDVGTNNLVVEGITVNEFVLGEIAKLQVLVENRWNRDLQGVFANLVVFNKDGQTMADVKSSSEDIPALSKKELVAFWDTVGVKEGEYDGKLIVRYGEKSTDKNLILRITGDELDITGIGFSIRDRSTGRINLVDVLFVIVIVLFIVNIVWFIFFRKMLKRRKRK